LEQEGSQDNGLEGQWRGLWTNCLSNEFVSMTEKKKFLLVSDGFYPEISPRSFRATELTKEFCRQGHEVTVITKFRINEYTDFLKEFPISLKMWSKPVFPKIPVFRKWPFSFFFRGIARVMALLFEYPVIEEMFQVKKKLKHEKGYNLMISFAVPYPVHWGVALSRSKQHRIADIWVADCGDPYMGDVLDSFRKPFYFRYLEKLFCRRADFISIPVESALSGYYPEFYNKIKIIPQGFNFDLAERKPEFKNNIPEFAYTGGFLHGIRDPKLLMEFLTSIDMPFRFYIYTNEPELLNKYKDGLKDKLIVSGYIAREDLMKRLAELDFLINFDNNTHLNVPSKLIDYAITNRPVLNINKDFCFEDIMSFLRGDYSKRMLLPDPEKYHIRNITKQFLDLINFEQN
jgi:hypothetical protein